MTFDGILPSMERYNPNQSLPALEAYLREALEAPVRLIQAHELTESTRSAPWRLDIESDGATHSYVLRTGTDGLAHEFAVLNAMQNTPLPVPRAYGLDEEGRSLGIPCFLSDFIEGEPLLEPLLAGKAWAEDLYIETVYALQSITLDDLPTIADQLEHQTAVDVLEEADRYFLENPQPLAQTVHKRLLETMPELPEARFSNGDLWVENIIVRDGKLAGVIDFEHAGFSDPIFEFLLSFFVEPKLCGRGIEEGYCRHMGFDPAYLHWYHGLEFFDTWRWAVKTGKTFVHHSADSLRTNLEEWLKQSQ